MQLILVHGYLAPAALLWPLGRRLARAGHTVELFGYASHLPRFDAHAAALAARIAARAAARQGPLGLVGHSLGGLLVHRAAELVPDTEIAAQIFVATPHRGSAAVRRALSLAPFGRRFFGPAAAAFGVAPQPRQGRWGAIAGTRDAMVRPAEAALPAPAPFLALPYSHNELVLRQATAAAIARFLETGRFD